MIPNSSKLKFLGSPAQFKVWNVAMKNILFLASCFIVVNFSAEAATGDCEKLEGVALDKYWEAHLEQYSDQATKDAVRKDQKKQSEFANAAKATFNKCRETELSDDQEKLELALNLAAVEFVLWAGTTLGIPPETLSPVTNGMHISVKDIENYGPCGGPNSFCNKPLGDVGDKVNQALGIKWGG